ncbi:hypothetical protein Barb4_01969 [Bacteroidales bacterium Barb4]|nr:hypothetical protein Barb4_01969 [Bacteroidales bacterium Barb4]
MQRSGMWGLDEIHLKQSPERAIYIQAIAYIINGSVVLSELIGNLLPNPTFRFAPCGAEIFRPFGTCAT